MAIVDQGDPAVAQALAAAVSRLGRGIASEPRRVQACLNDELMSDARAHRAEIDALVVAAEETIPDELAAGGFDRPAAMQRLSERGLSDEIASFSIDAWNYGLGLDAPGSPVPTLTNSVETPLVPAPAAAEPGTILPPPPGAPVAVGAVAGGVIADVAPVAPRYAPPPPQTVLPRSSPSTPISKASRKKFWLAGATSLVAVVAVISVLSLVITNGSSGDGAEGTEVELVSSTHDAEPTVWGAEMVRSWTQSDSGVNGELTFTNPTGAPITGSHIEAIPKSMAETADKISSPPETPFIVLKDDPIIRWDIEVPASGTVTIDYEVETAAPITDAQLEAWRVEAKAALVEYNATLDTTPPAFTIVNPLNLATLDQQEVTASGTGEPGSQIDFAGTPVVVDAVGNWQYSFGLGEGINNLVLSASDAAGNTYGPVTYTLTYSPPDSPPRRPDSSLPPRPDSSPLPRPDDPPRPPPDDPPPPPPDSPPLVPSFSISGPSYVSIGTTTTYYVNPIANVSYCEMAVRGRTYATMMSIWVNWVGYGTEYVYARCYSSDGTSSGEYYYAVTVQ